MGSRNTFLPCSKSVGTGERVARRATGSGGRQRGKEEEQSRKPVRRERARRRANGGGRRLDGQRNGYKPLKSLEILRGIYRVLHAIYRDKINLS